MADDPNAAQDEDDTANSGQDVKEDAEDAADNQGTQGAVSPSGKATIQADFERRTAQDQGDDPAASRLFQQYGINAQQARQILKDARDTLAQNAPQMINLAAAQKMSNPGGWGNLYATSLGAASDKQQEILQQLQKYDMGMADADQGSLNAQLALLKARYAGNPRVEAKEVGIIGAPDANAPKGIAQQAQWFAQMEGYQPGTPEFKDYVEKWADKANATPDPKLYATEKGYLPASQAIGQQPSSKGAAMFSDPEQQLLAAMADKNVNLPVGMRSQNQIHATLQGLIARHPELSSDEIADGIKSGTIELTASKAEARTAGTGLGHVDWATNEIDSTAPLLLQASKEVPRGSFVPLNKLMTDYRNGVVQDPSQRTLAVYVNSMMNAYDMLAARGGTDATKRNEAHALLMQADSPESLEAAVTAFRHEAAAARQAGSATISQVSNRGGSGAQQQPEATDGVKATTSKADYDALPKGAKYTKPGDPPNSFRVKQ